MPDLGSYLTLSFAGCDAMSPVDCALLGDDDDDACNADRSKWKFYSNKRFSPSYTWYGDSGTTRHMSTTRKGMYENKSFKGMSRWTASDRMLPILGNGALHLGVIQG